MNNKERLQQYLDKCEIDYVVDKKIKLNGVAYWGIKKNTSFIRLANKLGEDLDYVDVDTDYVLVKESDLIEKYGDPFNFDIMYYFRYVSDEEVQKLRDRRCKAIKKRLVEYNIPVNKVCDGNIFDIGVYKIELKEEIADLKWTISRVLNIPIEWMGYWGEKGVIIKEDEFNGKYCNSLEDIEFPDDWSIVGKDAEDVELRLNINNISCRVSFDDCGDFEYFIIKILDEDCHMCDISKALNIDVADVGIVESDKYYIVEIRNDE